MQKIQKYIDTLTISSACNLFTITAFTVISILRVESGCNGNVDLNEKFGRISFRESLVGKINNCSWTFYPESFTNTAVLIRFATSSPPRGRPPRPPWSPSFNGGRRGPSGRSGENSPQLTFPGGTSQILMKNFATNVIQLY